MNVVNIVILLMCSDTHEIYCTSAFPGRGIPHQQLSLFFLFKKGFLFPMEAHFCDEENTNPVSHNYDLVSHNYDLVSHNYDVVSHYYDLLSHYYVLVSHNYDLVSLTATEQGSHG